MDPCHAPEACQTYTDACTVRADGTCGPHEEDDHAMNPFFVAQVTMAIVILVGSMAGAGVLCLAEQVIIESSFFVYPYVLAVVLALSAVFHYMSYATDDDPEAPVVRNTRISTVLLYAALVCVLVAIAGFVYKFPASEQGRTEAIAAYFERQNFLRGKRGEPELPPSDRPTYDRVTHCVKPLAVLLVLTGLITASTGVMHHEHAQALRKP